MVESHQLPSLARPACLEAIKLTRSESPAENALHTLPRDSTARNSCWRVVLTSGVSFCEGDDDDCNSCGYVRETEIYCCGVKMFQECLDIEIYCSLLFQE